MGETRVPQKKAVDQSRREVIKNIGKIGLGLATVGITRNLFAYTGPKTNGKEGKGKESPAPVQTAISAQGRGRVSLNGFEVIVAPEPTDRVKNYEFSLGRAITLQFKDLLDIGAPLNQSIFIKLPDDHLLSTAQPTPLKAGGVDSFSKETLITGIKMAGDPKTYFYLFLPGATCMFYLSLSPDMKASDGMQKYMTNSQLIVPTEPNPPTLIMSSGAFAAVIGNAEILVFSGSKLHLFSVQGILKVASKAENKPITKFNTIKISEDAGDVRIDIDTISKPYFISTTTGDLMASEGP